MKEMEIVCRICLQLVSSSYSEPVEDVTKEVLKVLLIDIDLSLSENPVICLRCKRRIGEFCDFKVMCIETEDLLQPYLRKKTNAEVDLKCVYLDSLTSEDTMCNSEILKLCRLCMKSKYCEYYSLSIEVLAIFGIKQTFLEKFLPEVSLSATKSPIICQSCLKLFVSFAKFVMSWSSIDQNIIGYCNMTRIGSQINLGKIARFIKIVTPGLIPSDEQEDLHFLRCIASIDTTGNQERMEELVQPKVENRSEDLEISKTTVAEQLEEVAEQLITDEQKQAEKEKLGVKKQAETKPTIVNENHGKISKHTKNRASKKKTVVEDQTRVRKKQPVGEQTQARAGKPRSQLGPAQRQLIVLIEKLVNSKANQAELLKNTTIEPKIEANQSTSTGKKTYSCPKCDFISIYKQCVHKHFFRKHQFISCADCAFTTTSKNELKVHITKLHKLFRCSYCPRIYTTSMGRRVHMNTQHVVSSKMFQCKQCDFKSKYQSNMKKHAEKHSERKLVHRCDRCSYSSNFKNNVRRHALSHLDPSEGEMFKCYQCSYETRWKDDLKHHIKYIHLDDTELFQCPKCPFKTKYKAFLAVHSHKHDNIVYRCEKCTFRTVNKESWKRHCLEHDNS